MSERATRAETLVVRSSQIVPSGAKLVWLEDWFLDRAGAGCWLTHDQLALRLGMNPRTVEEHRLHLTWCGLHERLSQGRSKPSHWRATVPVEASVRSERPAYDSIIRARVALDGALPRRWPPQCPGKDRDHPGPVVPETAGEAPGIGRGLLVPVPAVPGDSTAVDSSRDTTSDALEVQKAEEISDQRLDTKAEEAGALSRGVLPQKVGNGRPGTGPVGELSEPDERPESLVRAEGLALIRLQLGKRLTVGERELVRGWLARHPGKSVAI